MVDMWAFQLSRHQLGFLALHSAGTDEQLMGHPMFPWTTGTVEAGSRAHTKRELVTG